MKGRYFLFVLCAVVCTVWREAESQDCNFIEMGICLGYLKVPIDESKILFFMNREEVDLVCPNVNRGLQCLESYFRRCIAEEDRHYFDSNLKFKIQFLKNRCEPGPFQEEYLLHSPCLRQIKDDHAHCLQQLEQNAGDFAAKQKYPDRRPANEIHAGIDSDKRDQCCIIRDYVVCFQRRAMEKCGEQAANYVEDELYQLPSALGQVDCKSYKCQDSSASWNFQCPLLLPVSLAMLSLYALRSA